MSMLVSILGSSPLKMSLSATRKSDPRVVPLDPVAVCSSPLGVPSGLTLKLIVD